MKHVRKLLVEYNLKYNNLYKFKYLTVDFDGEVMIHEMMPSFTEIGGNEVFVPFISGNSEFIGYVDGDLYHEESPYIIDKILTYRYD